MNVQPLACAPKFCTPNIRLMNDIFDAPIPALYVQSADGALWISYLTDRLAAWRAVLAAEDGVVDPAARAAWAAAWPEIRVSFVSSGPMLPSERAAVEAIMTVSTMDALVTTDTG